MLAAPVSNVGAEVRINATTWTHEQTMVIAVLHKDTVNMRAFLLCAKSGFHKILYTDSTRWHLAPRMVMNSQW